jgi:hypothetical protein
VTNDEPEPPGHEEVRALMGDGSLAGVMRHLTSLYPDAASGAEEAVYSAIATYLAKRKNGAVIDEPVNWIFVVAKNYILKCLERRINRETPYDLVFRQASTEDNVHAGETYEYLKGLVDRWESRRLRVVTALYLESYYIDEPLSQVEAAEQASLLLDEDVPWTSIGKTRARGLQRLREQILQIASDTGINPI